MFSIGIQLRVALRRAPTTADTADRARGRAIAEAALTDFRTPEMVLQANLVEQCLRAGG